MSLAPNPPDPPALPPEIAAWIGRSIERSDVISPRMAAAFEATLAPHLAAANRAPLGIFWSLAPDIVAPIDLGHDGHPRLGLFLPVLPYPRRMWAGGELAFQGEFAVGDLVTKTSTIDAIAFKTGSTGKLAFVTVRHEYRVGERLVLGERQDVVYRDAAGERTAAPSNPKNQDFGPAAKSWTVEIDPTFLFRYSALTFNGHRIHYDRPYATNVEGYDGIVVHGPLQATLMLNLATDSLGRAPRRFRYRGQSPLVCGAPIRVEAGAVGESGLKLRVVSGSGATTMTAEAALAV